MTEHVRAQLRTFEVEVNVVCKRGQAGPAISHASVAGDLYKAHFTVEADNAFTAMDLAMSEATIVFPVQIAEQRGYAIRSCYCGNITLKDTVTERG